MALFTTLLVWACDPERVREEHTKSVSLGLGRRRRAQRLFLARVNAALRAVSRRLRVVAALRPAARRFRVNAPFWPGVSLALDLAFIWFPFLSERSEDNASWPDRYVRHLAFPHRVEKEGSGKRNYA